MPLPLLHLTIRLHTRTRPRPRDRPCATCTRLYVCLPACVSVRLFIHLFGSNVLLCKQVCVRVFVCMHVDLSVVVNAFALYSHAFVTSTLCNAQFEIFVWNLWLFSFWFTHYKSKLLVQTQRGEMRCEETTFFGVLCGRRTNTQMIQIHKMNFNCLRADVCISNKSVHITCISDRHTHACTTTRSLCDDELCGKLLAKVPFLSYYGERINSTHTISAPNSNK